MAEPSEDGKHKNDPSKGEGRVGIGALLLGHSMHQAEMEDRRLCRTNKQTNKQTNKGPSESQSMHDRDSKRDRSFFGSLHITNASSYKSLRSPKPRDHGPEAL